MAGSGWKAAGGYPATHWSQIYLASQPEQTAGQEALARICEVYRPALLGHLQGRFGLSAEDTEDLLQNFIAQRILEKNLLARADASKGKFRSFLMKALDNYVLDQERRRQCKKRAPAAGMVPLDDLDEFGATGARNSDGSGFDHDWALSVLAQAEELTRAFYEKKQAEGTWGVFRDGFLLPLRAGERRPSDAELAERHGFVSARQVSNAITTAKREFGKLLRIVVRNYVEDEGAVDDEIRELIAILSES